MFFCLKTISLIILKKKLNAKLQIKIKFLFLLLLNLNISQWRVGQLGKNNYFFFTIFNELLSCKNTYIISTYQFFLMIFNKLALVILQYYNLFNFIKFFCFEFSQIQQLSFHFKVFKFFHTLLIVFFIEKCAF